MITQDEIAPPATDADLDAECDRLIRDLPPHARPADGAERDQLRRLLADALAIWRQDDDEEPLEENGHVSTPRRWAANSWRHSRCAEIAARFVIAEADAGLEGAEQALADAIRGELPAAARRLW